MFVMVLVILKLIYWSGLYFCYLLDIANIVMMVLNMRKNDNNNINHSVSQGLLLVQYNINDKYNAAIQYKQFRGLVVLCYSSDSTWLVKNIPDDMPDAAGGSISMRNAALEHDLFERSLQMRGWESWTDC